VRGVDQKALLKAVEERGIYAGLDVFEGEPQAPKAPMRAPFRRRERLLHPPHRPSTDQAQEAVRRSRSHREGADPDRPGAQRYQHQEGRVATHLLLCGTWTKSESRPRVRRPEGRGSAFRRWRTSSSWSKARSHRSRSIKEPSRVRCGIKRNDNIFDPAFPIQK